MKTLNRTNVNTGRKKPLKIIQFGEGNFLRAFVDYAIEVLNVEQDFNAGVAVVQPIEKGMVDSLKGQDGLYNLFASGISKGEIIQEKHLVTCIEKCIDPYADFQDFISLAKEESLQFVISNTTEAGISYNDGDGRDMEPPNSFPAKLTVLLFERFSHFNGAGDKGLAILPCELINNNADTLKTLILEYCDAWHLGDGFRNWLIQNNSFHNTLVDRIVPGYPKADIEAYQSKLNYYDNLIVTAELFFLWVIEGDSRLQEKLPFQHTKLQVKIVDSIQPFRTRKVRILNGVHTAMVPISILFGNETVKETVDDDFTGEFVKHVIFDEIIPTLSMDKAELEQYANEVLDRFKNPFINHQLASIALNSVSKFKVRVLPSILQYTKINGALPVRLTFAFACLLQFYKGDWKGRELPVKDDLVISEHISELWKRFTIERLVYEILAKKDYWGLDLNEIEGLSEALANALELLKLFGVKKGLEKYKATV